MDREGRAAMLWDHAWLVVPSQIWSVKAAIEVRVRVRVRHQGTCRLISPPSTLQSLNPSVFGGRA